jgi:four helix bundle protein
MLYNLEERTTAFSELIIIFCQNLPRTKLIEPLAKQLIRSGTSIGANYMEANNAASKKDFRNKIKICQKEANETQYWLRLLGKLNNIDIITCRKLWQEAHELLLIFAKISATSDKRIRH